jgi:hypothetical protein
MGVDLYPMRSHSLYNTVSYIYIYIYVENGSWSPVVPGYDALVATWRACSCLLQAYCVFPFARLCFWASAAGFGVCMDL